MINILWHIFVL